MCNCSCSSNRNLTLVDTIATSDKVYIYDNTNGAERVVSFETLRNAVPTIASVGYAGTILTITMTDGSSFPVDLA